MDTRVGFLSLLVASVLIAVPSAAEAVVIVLDNDPAAGPGSQDGTVVFSTGWQTSTSNPLHWDRNYHHNQNQPGRLVTYTPDLPIAGEWTVDAWWTSDGNRAAAAPYTIKYDGVSTTIPVDQRVDGGEWNTLGTFTFEAGSASSVEIASAPSGYVIADAIRFSIPDPPLPPAPIDVTLDTLDDAHIRGGSNANNNYGLLDYIQIKRQDGTNSRKAYLKFPTDALTLGFDPASELQGAELLLPFILGAGGAPSESAQSTFNVYGILDDSWDESTITWNNAPANDTSSTFLMDPTAEFLGLFRVFGTGEGETIRFSSPELADFIRAAGVDDFISLAITRETSQAALGATYVHTLSANVVGAGSIGPQLHLAGGEFAVIPEPGTLCLLGLSGLLLRRRRRT